MTAASGLEGQFFYRRNQDDSIDAICSSYFLTAATADGEEKLHELEATHRCHETSEEPWYRLFQRLQTRIGQRVFVRNRQQKQPSVAHVRFKRSGVR
jgi:hypothetical protein